MIYDARNRMFTIGRIVFHEDAVKSKLKGGNMGIEFHRTGYGRKFLGADLPNLIRAVERVGDQLEKFNETMGEISLTNISVDGEKLEPFIRKVITEQMYFDREAKGAAKRGNNDG